MTERPYVLFFVNFDEKAENRYISVIFRGLSDILDEETPEKGVHYGLGLEFTGLVTIDGETSRDGIRRIISYMENLKDEPGMGGGRPHLDILPPGSFIMKRYV